MNIGNNKRILIWLKTNGKCFYCGIDTSMIEGNDKNAFRVDHVIPVAVGGGDEIDNLVPCCNACNNAKGKRTLEEFKFYRWQSLIEKKYGARFTRKQEKALKKMGFEFPMPSYVFWFEKQNIKISNYESMQKCSKKYMMERRRKQEKLEAEHKAYIKKLHKEFAQKEEEYEF